MMPEKMQFAAAYASVIFLKKKTKNNSKLLAVYTGYIYKYVLVYCLHIATKRLGERTGLLVRASDSGSIDPGSILGRVGVLFP